MFRFVFFCALIAMSLQIKGIPLTALIGESSLMFLISGLIFSVTVVGLRSAKAAFLGLDRASATSISKITVCFLGVSAFTGMMACFMQATEQEFTIAIVRAVGIPVLYAALVSIYLLGVNKPALALNLRPDMHTK